MKSLVTSGIVLARINFGEADRIITVLTPDQGKLRLMAKGVRRVKSKLAGGIELFSISQITFMPGRGEIGTLVSSRLDRHFGKIVGNLDRTMFGYELLKMFNNVTEDLPETEYFDLLIKTLESLDDFDVSTDLIRLWVRLQLLKMAGHSIELAVDKRGEPLTTGGTYSFSVEDMRFEPDVNGTWTVRHLKLLKLASGLTSPAPLIKISDINRVLPNVSRLAELASQTYLQH